MNQFWELLRKMEKDPNRQLILPSGSEEAASDITVKKINKEEEVSSDFIADKEETHDQDFGEDEVFGDTDLPEDRDELTRLMSVVDINDDPAEYEKQLNMAGKLSKMSDFDMN